MKNVFKFILVVGVLWSAFAFGQEKSYTIDFAKHIGKEHLGDRNAKFEIVKASEFSEKFDGTMNVEYYINPKEIIPLKILSLTVTTTN